MLLADAEPHLLGFQQLEQRARAISSGGQSEIRMSVDSIFPNDRLFSALADFSSSFPYVHQKLRQGTFLSADSEFSVHNAHLCVAGLISHEYFVKPILDITMMAVARRNHPLHSIKHQLSRAETLKHTLVVIEGTASQNPKRQPHGPAQRFLPVSTIEAALDAVASGLCFGWLPVYRIRTQLDAGNLAPLCMPIGGTRTVRLNLVCKDSDLGSREVKAMADLLGLNDTLQVI
jgi:DNA-binding transcriptional LysR family regulator